MKKLAFSLLIFLLFLLGNLFLSVSPALAATLSFSPSSGTYGQGGTLKVDVNLNAGADSINAVQANFSYPADKLQFSSVSTGSVLSIVAEKTGGGGIVKVGGGNPTPFSGSKLIAIVYFKVLATSGSATLNFAGDSAAVRATDNQNALTGTSSATFTLSGADAPVVTKEGVAVGQAPRISNLRIENIGKNRATVKWATDIASTSEVSYGLTDSYGASASSETLVTNHEVDLSSSILFPGRTYHFKVTSKSVGGTEASSEDSTFITSGYTLKLKITDSQGRPLKGAEVIVYSEPRKGTTDKNGEVEFTNLSPGVHGVFVTYRGGVHNQEVIVAESDVPMTVDIKFSPQAVRTYVFLLFLSIFLLIALGLFYFLKIRKRRSLPPPGIFISPQT